jgi:hypothetical protein
MEPLDEVEEPEHWEEPGHWRPDPHADLTGWLAAAALLWFEVFGVLGLGIASIAAPMGCWGDPGPGPDAVSPCADGIPFYSDHLGLLWLTILGAAIGVVAMVWIATDGYPRAGAAAWLVLGGAAATGILWQLVGGPVFIPFAVFWLIVPALLFLLCAIRLLQRAGP